MPYIGIIAISNITQGRHQVFHVALIMDGNGRWAAARGKPRWWGHRKGAQVVERVLRVCQNHNVTHLTVYAFSPENWGRDPIEVQSLMQLFRWYLTKRLHLLCSERIRLRVVGDLGVLSTSLQHAICSAEKATQDFNDLVFTVCLNYGGREELVQAVRNVVACYQKTGKDAQSIAADDIQRHLWTSSLPDPDLLIRTGGEVRLSNFMLWQLRYTEFLFLPMLWPDFTPQDFGQAIATYQQRHRRFGQVGATSTSTADTRPTLGMHTDPSSCPPHSFSPENFL